MRLGDDPALLQQHRSLGGVDECAGQKELAAEMLASIAAREAASRRVIERGKIVHRSALLGDSPLKQRIRFLLEMPIANLFDFLR